MSRALLAVASLCLSVVAGAQSPASGQVSAPVGAENPRAALLDRLSVEKKAAAATTEKHAEVPFDAPEQTVSPATRAKYEEALREFYQYQISGLEHRQRVFRWQLVTSIVIFLVVLVLVGAGIYFAAVQFRSSMIPIKDANGELKLVSTTQIKASLQGVEVSSSILGVIILVLSLAFFYLYLVYVYPIHEIF